MFGQFCRDARQAAIHYNTGKDLGSGREGLAGSADAVGTDALAAFALHIVCSGDDGSTHQKRPSCARRARRLLVPYSVPLPSSPCALRFKARNRSGKALLFFALASCHRVHTRKLLQEEQILTSSTFTVATFDESNSHFIANSQGP
eukprot:6187264-Pleurochrysis_carterae.AAC.12